MLLPAQTGFLSIRSDAGRRWLLLLSPFQFSLLYSTTYYGVLLEAVVLLTALYLSVRYHTGVDRTSSLSFVIVYPARWCSSLFSDGMREQTRNR